MNGFEPAIGRAFNFTAEELAENRAGRLTPDQELVWRNTVRAWERGTGRGARMLGLGIAAAAAATVVVGSQTPGTDSTTWIVAAVILALVGTLGFAFIRRGRRATATLGRTTLQEAVGEFRWSSDLNARWWGQIGEARFGIDRLQEEALETGDAYRVHYVPSDGGAWVLSIERVGHGAGAIAAEGS